MGTRRVSSAQNISFCTLTPSCSCARIDVSTRTPGRTTGAPDRALQTGCSAPGAPDRVRQTPYETYRMTRKATKTCFGHNLPQGSGCSGPSTAVSRAVNRITANGELSGGRATTERTIWNGTSGRDPA